jgi:hypothetical protein
LLGAALLVRRAAVGGQLFDDGFAPAYCEDADLCLRLIAAGHRIRYVASADVVHYLSVSTNRQKQARKLRTIARNQQKLMERWGDLLGRLDAVRPIAFHLPQFHTTPENELWWGADEPLDSAGVRGLFGACDCFVSLHRAEGFGRGLGEAMALGRLAMGTAWSGNMDFMTEANSLLVRSRQVRVPRDAYPHWNGQSWAEPDIDHAAALLCPVLEDPARGRAMAARGQRDVLQGWSYRAVGLRILDRLEAIAATSAKLRDVTADRPAPKAPPRRRATVGT